MKTHTHIHVYVIFVSQETWNVKKKIQLSIVIILNLSHWLFFYQQSFLQFAYQSSTEFDLLRVR